MLIFHYGMELNALTIEIIVALMLDYHGSIESFLLSSMTILKSGFAIIKGILTKLSLLVN